MYCKCFASDRAASGRCAGGANRGRGAVVRAGSGREGAGGGERGADKSAGPGESRVRGLGQRGPGVGAGGILEEGTDSEMCEGDGIAGRGGMGLKLTFGTFF